MPSVTVALVGGLEQAFTESALFDDVDREKKWAERKSLELEVADDEPLGSILRRAGDVLGVKAPGPTTERAAPVPTFVAFFNDAEEHEIGAYGTSVTLVDDEGRARWGVPFESATFRDVVRASEAGALGGDARRLYYVTHPGIGNGVLITFTAMIGALRLLYDLLQVTATIEDNIGLAQRVFEGVRRRIGQGREVLDEKSATWERQGGDPTALEAMLRSRVWHPADLAPLLDCDEGQAKAVLSAFGYSLDSGGLLWRRGTDEEAQVLDDLLAEVQLSYALGHDDFEDTLTKRVRYYLSAGERAPRPFIDATTFGDHQVADAVSTEGEDAVGTYADHPDDELFFGGVADRTDGELPLEHMRMACACGKPECVVSAEFGMANGRLKVGFTGLTDHFVIDAGFMARVAEQVEFAIEEAKEPPSGD